MYDLMVGIPWTSQSNVLRRGVKEIAFHFESMVLDLQFHGA
jgi:hypothetical protein